MNPKIFPEFTQLGKDSHTLKKEVTYECVGSAEYYKYWI